ncbi:MAG: ATP-binding protein [Bacteroidetes bacterium]|nr:ATP-binding protein [Bacteroidota bacterium]
MFNFVKKWLVNLKISTRTALSFFAIIFTALITSASAILLLQYAKQIDFKLSNNFEPAITATKDIEYIMSETGRYTYDWVYNPSKDKKLKLQKILDKQYRKRKIFLIELLQQPELEQSRKRLVKVGGDFEKIIVKEKNIMSLLKTDADYNNPLKFSSAHKIYKEIEIDLKKLDTDIEEVELMVIAASRKLSQKKYASYSTLSSLLVIMLIGLVVVSVISLMITNSTVIKPVSELSEVLDAVGRGQIVNYQMNLARRDEIGVIQKSTLTLIKGLKAKADIANAIGKGNYDIELKLQGKNDKLGKALIEMRDNLKSSMLKEIESKKSLEKYTLSLEKKNKELDQFAYITSHDLKSPLRGINNLSEWIEEDMGELMTEDSKGYFKLMRGRIHRLESLINSLLKYSRSGKLGGEKEWVDSRSMVLDLLKLINPSIHHTIYFDDALPKIWAVRKDIEDVFYELLSNSVKYANPKRPIINITYQHIDEKHKFCIADNGLGIASEYHNKIFTIFQTLEARDKFESVGAGLAIAKKIVDENNGNIWVESEPNKGARFYFTWLDSDTN